MAVTVAPPRDAFAKSAIAAVLPSAARPTAALAVPPCQPAAFGGECRIGPENSDRKPAPAVSVATTGRLGLIRSLIDAARTRRVYSRQHGGVLVSARARVSSQRKQVTLILRW
jgi:hypothetical protein